MERERSDICFNYSAKYFSARFLTDQFGPWEEKAYQIVGLPYLIRRLFQPPLRSINSPIALVDVLLHVAHVVVLESEFALFCRSFILGFEGLAVHFRAWPEILLRVCEEIVRAGADEERTAHFGVIEGELRVS